ncbi:PepSY domain-containing protein [Singulisphaera sp. Ch08]|uniref:PepSY domain-containing protein n=1 Tax=Singulisphaera sp. Ch08 TaxID=3120278 RepID=A0AAU7CLL5_9BACT
MKPTNLLTSEAVMEPPPLHLLSPETESPAQTATLDRPEPTKSTRAVVRPRVTESLFRVIWRWHFYAGMIIAPVLVVMSITGGLYIFKSEIEEFARGDILFVKPGTSRVSYQAQVDAALAASPGFVPSQIQIHNDANRATLVTLRPAGPGQDKAPPRDRGRRSRVVSVNPYDGKIVGVLSGNSNLNTFFTTILTIHRTLWAGTTGRVITELTTSWSLVLLATGLYLWWPRKKAKAAGVWTVRWKTKLYTRLRDLHSVGGFYLLPICALIVGTGMFYTLSLGTVIHEAAEVWVGGDEEPRDAGRRGESATAKVAAKGLEGERTGPEGRPAATKGERTRLALGAQGGAGRAGAAQVQGPKALPLDDLLTVMKAKYPDRILFATLGNGGGRRRPTTRPAPQNSMQVSAGNDFNRTYGPIISTNVTLDKSTGKILKQKSNSEEPFFWHAWTYPLHVGSFWGLSTKIPWFIACVVLTALPITGLWMWWERRPKGKVGLPRKPEVRMPWWLGALIGVLCIMLPMMGASVALILLGEGVVRLFRRFRRPIATVA